MCANVTGIFADEDAHFNGAPNGPVYTVFQVSTTPISYNLPENGRDKMSNQRPLDTQMNKP